MSSEYIHDFEISIWVFRQAHCLDLLPIICICQSKESGLPATILLLPWNF